MTDNRKNDRPAPIFKDKRKQTGLAGEQAAAEFLQSKGYLILERNWRCRTGELDIIALNDKTLVIVEVRSRSASSSVFGTPAESVNYRKIAQVRKTAQVYLHQKGSGIDSMMEIRFDVVSVIIGANSRILSIDHLPAAF